MPQFAYTTNVSESRLTDFLMLLTLCKKLENIKILRTLTAIKYGHGRANAGRISQIGNMN
jgi:hypothetical protein